MRLSSAEWYSLHSEGFRAVLSDIYTNPLNIKMKYAVFFLLCCLALAAAAPQFLTYPGVVAPAVAPIARTVVAGPTVVNTGLTGFPSVITPGVVGTYI